MISFGDGVLLVIARDEEGAELVAVEVGDMGRVVDAESAVASRVYFPTRTMNSGTSGTVSTMMVVCWM